MTSDHLTRSRTLRPTAPSAVVDPDLATQIEQVEQRLIAREAWLRSTGESLAQKAQHAVTPRPWVLPVVGVGVVLWLGRRLWHRREPERQISAVVPPSVAGRQNDVLAGLPWAGLTALGWPLTPLAWRERLSPAAAATVVSTVLSVGRRLLRRHGS